MFAGESIAFSLWNCFCLWPDSDGSLPSFLEGSKTLEGEVSIMQSAVSYLSFYVGWSVL